MTRTSKKIKIIISLLAVVIILSSITIIPANAYYTPSWERARAFIAAAITALNIGLESATMTAADIVDYIVDPLEITYTYPDAWADRPQIQIWKDYVVIDGQYFTDIWVSNEAAEKFRVNAFDFKTAYSIASNTNGTFKSGVGTADGIPVFTNGNNTITQNYSVPIALGNYQISDNGYGDNIPASNNRINMGYTYNNTRYGYYSNVNPETSQQKFTIRYYADNVSPSYLKAQYSSNGGNTYYDITGTSIPFVYYPFDFDYVAETIPSDEPLPSDTGMMIRVPSDDGQGNRYFDDFLTDYPEFNQGEPVTIDVNLDPDIMNKLDDLINIIAPIIPVINNNEGDVTFVENHDSPTPPIVDTLLPDTFWSQLENKLDQIRQTIQNLTPDFSQIIQNIQTIPQSISNLGDQIVRDIEEGPIRLLDKLIDVLRTLFFPILATLRNFLGIWHYVVTWMSNISAPFTWIMGIMYGTSAILVSPIYALIAGIIVIAVYRRFGR